MKRSVDFWWHKVTWAVGCLITPSCLHQGNLYRERYCKREPYSTMGLEVTTKSVMDPASINVRKSRGGCDFRCSDYHTWNLLKIETKGMTCKISSQVWETYSRTSKVAQQWSPKSRLILNTELLHEPEKFTRSNSACLLQTLMPSIFSFAFHICRGQTMRVL